MDLGPAREPDIANLNVAARGHLDRADPRRPRRPRRRSGGRRSRTRHDPARIRRGAAASAAASARGADPVRGAPLAGDGGRRAARLERRVGQQRAAARARNARRRRRERRPIRRRPLDEADRALLARYVAAFEQYDIDALTALIQEDAHAVDAAVRPVAARSRRHLHVVVRAGDRLQRLARDPDRRGERLARVRPVQAERRRATATSRGRCRCSSSRVARSSSSPSSSTPRSSSRSSACPLTFPS